MITIDGVTLDITKPETLKGVTLMPGGFITQRQDGVTTHIKRHDPWCKSNQVLMSDPPQFQKCNCGFTTDAGVA